MADGYKIPNTKLRILPALEDDALPIPVRSWERLKAKVRRISFDFQFFPTIGGALLGGFLSIVLLLLTGEGTRSKTELIFLSAVLLFLGVICLVVDANNRRNLRTSSGDVLEDMEAIEENYQPRKDVGL